MRFLPALHNMRAIIFYSLLFLTKAAGAEEHLRVHRIEDHDTLIALATAAPPVVGDVLAVKSGSDGGEIIGFVRVQTVQDYGEGQSLVRADLMRLSAQGFVQVGDALTVVNLKGAQPGYLGRTELLVGSGGGAISAKYRPLYTQGFSIGETAATLDRNEFLVGIWGQASYGWTERISIGAFLPGFFLGSPNGNMKVKVYDHDHSTVSLGMTAVKVRDAGITTANINLFWDSVTSSRMTSHTLLTFAAVTLEKIDETVAVKTAGTSSLQTGYEIILDNWDRVLFGPSYNFETKSVGGYLGYQAIWDRFHLLASLSTVDIRELKYSPQSGYVGLIEAFWRF